MRISDWSSDVCSSDLNAKELTFGLLDSGYQVGTAKAAGVGRSDTIQFFHGSEVAHWANAEEHAAGALQAVPRAAGTEVILESTANGVGGLFYNLWQAAVRGEGDYQAIFIPWFRHGDYPHDGRRLWSDPRPPRDRESVGEGKGGSTSVVWGGPRNNKKKK